MSDIVSVETRRRRIEEALAARSSDGQNAKLPWQGKDVIFPVVRLPLNCVVFNPHSHRIKAQVLSHPHYAAIEADPFSEESQRILAELIRGRPGSEMDAFDKLKANLHSAGQRDPGVVTRNGVLINANTRAVALRELHEEYIDVAVLPADALEPEIAKLELKLQVSRSYLRDYTYVNTLLFIDDLQRNNAYDRKTIARELEWAVSDDPTELKRGERLVSQALRILSWIREMQQFSPKSIPLEFFNDKRQHLLEADDLYNRLKKGDTNEAEAVRYQKLAAIVAGVTFTGGYRAIKKSSFITDFLMPAVEKEESLESLPEILEQHPKADFEIDPLGLGLPPALSAPGSAAELIDVSRNLLKITAQDAGEVHSLTPGDEGERLQAGEQLEGVRHAFEFATHESKLAEKEANNLQAPFDWIYEIKQRLDKIEKRTLLDRPDGFDLVRFRRDYQEMSDKVQKIEQAL